MYTVFDVLLIDKARLKFILRLTHYINYLLTYLLSEPSSYLPLDWSVSGHDCHYFRTNC